MIVLIIKAAISPHTPIAAYLAVFLQGILGEIFFFSKRFSRLSPLLFGLSIGVLTGSQRIITYTIVFGTTFWEAINEFIKYVIKEFFLSTNEAVALNFSFVLIGIYILIHVIVGLTAGIISSKLPQKLNSETAKQMIINEMELLNIKIEAAETKKRKRSRWKKLFFNTIILFAFILLLITYINPQAMNLSSKSVLVMSIRGILITIIWFNLLAPIILRALKNLLSRKQNSYSEIVNNIINHLPYYRNMVTAVWRISSKEKGLRRLNYFITAALINILALKFQD
ncbi:MAG: hypothetical protein HXY50_16705 [Ignavibacteriaceae bacterium]|nr:hypothetical protein [Ignavibacteriaceae bacterium]